MFCHKRLPLLRGGGIPSRGIDQYFLNFPRRHTYREGCTLRDDAVLEIFEFRTPVIENSPSDIYVVDASQEHMRLEDIWYPKWMVLLKVVGCSSRVTRWYRLRTVHRCFNRFEFAMLSFRKRSEATLARLWAILLYRLSERKRGLLQF